MTRWQKGVIIAVAVLLVAALVTMTTLYVVDRDQYRNAKESEYRKAYFATVDGVKDIDAKLSKVAVSGGVKTQNSLLYDIWLDSEMVADGIGELTAKEVSGEKLIKFFNQLGDYCRSVADGNGDGLSFVQQEKLVKLHAIVDAVSDAFDESAVAIMDGESLVGKVSEGILILGDGYGNFNNDSTVEYPEMIYDGPFSDAIAMRKAKYLTGLAEISVSDAEAIITAKFPGASDIEFVSENNASVPSYLLGFNMDGAECSACVTKAGGLVSGFNRSEIPTDTLLEAASIAEVADGVAVDFGYSELSVVWYTNQDSMIYVNLAYKQDGVIFYPDMVKLKFSGESGKLLALDATGYIYNHTARSTPEEKYTASEAKAKVSSLLNISAVRLVVIPTDWNTELVAYEFAGTYSGDTYYVYISADRLEEIKVMKVVEENGGILVE